VRLELVSNSQVLNHAIHCFLGAKGGKTLGIHTRGKQQHLSGRGEGVVGGGPASIKLWKAGQVDPVFFVVLGAAIALVIWGGFNVFGKSSRPQKEPEDDRVSEQNSGGCMSPMLNIVGGFFIFLGFVGMLPSRDCQEYDWWPGGLICTGEPATDWWGVATAWAIALGLFWMSRKLR